MRYAASGGGNRRRGSDGDTHLPHLWTDCPARALSHPRAVPAVRELLAASWRGTPAPAVGAAPAARARAPGVQPLWPTRPAPQPGPLRGLLPVLVAPSRGATPA